MKRKTLSFAAILFVATILNSCSKKDSTSLPDTKLIVKVKNAETGYYEASATVKLYISSTDLDNGTNAVATQTADLNGQATFSGLQSRKYYWRAQSGCRSNYFDEDATAYDIPANTTSSVEGNIRGIGKLQFTNASNEPYKVEVNGITIMASQAGGTTFSINAISSVFYTVKVYEINYILNQTVKTYTGTLPCGITLLTTYP